MYLARSQRQTNALAVNDRTEVWPSAERQEARRDGFVPLEPFHATRRPFRGKQGPTRPGPSAGGMAYRTP